MIKIVFTVSASHYFLAFLQLRILHHLPNQSDYIDPPWRNQNRREHQAGLRKVPSGVDQTATLSIIKEESSEGNTALLIYFVDFEKAS